MKETGKPVFFKTPSAFRKWLEKNHDKKTEIFVGYYKKDSGKKTMTWPESVDEALCFGWIDGIRKSIDSESYYNRFTPRRPNSNWSAINIKKIEELTERGLIRTAGIAAFNKRQESKSKIYSYENAPVALAPEFEKLFKANKKAWLFFQSQRRYYQTQATNWVMSAKQSTTRISRLEKLISLSQEQKKY